MSRPPFPGARPISTVLPTEQRWMDARDRRRVADLPRLLRGAMPALVRELGAPVHLVRRDPKTGPRWLVGPKEANPELAAATARAATEPVIEIDRRRQVLLTDGPDMAAVFEAFGMLRALGRLPDGRHTFGDCATPALAAARVAEEVAETWPSFQLRGVDWGALCRRWVPRVEQAADPVAALRTWLAALGDAHTALREAEPVGALPYRVHLTPDAAVLWEVPQDSAGWAAGARPGMRVVGEPLAEVWAQTGASAHQRPWLAGRRLLQGPVGAERAVTVRAAGGRTLTWTEVWPEPFGRDLVQWGRLRSGVGWLRIGAWWPPLEAVVAGALDELRGCPVLLVDLRGNGGGSMAMATRFRDRFLRRRTHLGTLRLTGPGGALQPEQPLWGEPAPGGDRWPGEVAFLTDALTYSASEDCLLGLQGLPHVRVLGTPSGGGSGRLRVMRLLPGFRLTISSGLTWDRRRRCIEGAGVPVDHVLAAERPSEDDVVLRAVDRLLS